MYVVFYFQPLPAMLKSPFELNRECLPLRDHINDDFKNHHRIANYLTPIITCAKNSMGEVEMDVCPDQCHRPLAYLCLLPHLEISLL